MSKTIKILLSEESVRSAIKQVEAYRDGISRKMETLFSRLADIGIDVARATIDSIPSDEKGSTYPDKKDLSSNGVTVFLGGDKVLFVEFGAGIAFSQPQNPKAAEMGYGLGTYPGQTHAYQESGWYYSTAEGSKHSRGNAPYMPLYKADMEIQQRVREIAKEVFGG